MKLDWGSIGTSLMYGIGSPPKKYRDTSSTLLDTCLLPLLKVIWVVDSLLLDHVELPYVFDLAVHLVHFLAGWSKVPTALWGQPPVPLFGGLGFGTGLVNKF